ncbi:MAG TPA: thermonuclease family protein [Vicinamibacterales bacterium]|jgi:endonuclease YncB( thermonuclease family)
MQKLIAGMLTAVAVFRSDPVLVTRVTSGDAITVATVGRVGLLGVEAQPGPRARERLESLVVQRWVRLEYDETPGSRASVHRAYVMLDTGEFVNATLVREGLARVAPHGKFSRREELERAENEARRFRRGLWAGYTAVRPWQSLSSSLPSEESASTTSFTTDSITGRSGSSSSSSRPAR